MQEYNVEDFIIDEKKNKNTENKNKAYLAFNIVIYVLIFFFALFLGWYAYFKLSHEYYAISGESMIPTLNESGMDTDGVFINKWEKGKIGDVVILGREEDQRPIIKRIIATEGDLVTIKISKQDNNYHVYRIAKGTNLKKIKDEEKFRLDEDYINSYTAWTISVPTHSEWKNENIISYEKDFYRTFINSSGDYKTWISGSGTTYIYVPKGEIFFLGDNRDKSSDSRSNGTEKKEDILGKVDIIIKNVKEKNKFSSVLSYYYKKVEKFFAR